MKKTSNSINTISDIVSWRDRNELIISPKYQRNSVWNYEAKSYLIDTILKGLPIPPIFVRKKINIESKFTEREILDGQQRIRAILEFLDNEFSIKKSINHEYANMYYRDLNDEDKKAFLNYEFSIENIVEQDDSIIYDMFSRLNSNNYVLNNQEIRNSKYMGDFKILAYRLANKYRPFFLSTRIMDDKACIRMKDVELINSILIFALNGVVKETQKYTDYIYEKYNSIFEDCEKIERKVMTCMDCLILMHNRLGDNIIFFKNKNFFFTLFCVIYDRLISNNDYNSMLDVLNKRDDFDFITDRIEKFSNYYYIIISNKDNLDVKDKDRFLIFDELNRVRNTDKERRIKRIEMLSDYIFNLI